MAARVADAEVAEQQPVEKGGLNQLARTQAPRAAWAEAGAELVRTPFVLFRATAVRTALPLCAWRLPLGF